MDDLDDRLAALVTQLRSDGAEPRAALTRRVARRRRRRWAARIVGVALVAAVATLSFVALRDDRGPREVRTISPPRPTPSSTLPSSSSSPPPRPTPTPSSTSTPSSPPPPTGTALLVDDLESGKVSLSDLDSGTTRTVNLADKHQGDYSPQELVVGDRIVYAGNGLVSIRSDFSGPPVLLGDDSTFVPSSRPGWVWLMCDVADCSPTQAGSRDPSSGSQPHITQGLPCGCEEVQEVRADASAHGPVQMLPKDHFAIAGVPGGLLIGGATYSVWNQATGQVGPALFDDYGFVDVQGDVVAWGTGCAESTNECRSLRVLDLTTGAHHDYPAPQGMIGWMTTVGAGSRDAFSPNGRYLAARAGGSAAAGAKVFVLDLQSDAVTPVPASEEAGATAWSPDSRWVFFASTSHTVAGYRPSDGTTHTWAPACCATAVTALPG